MNALVYVDIDQGIHKGKMKVALNEKRKKLRGFSFSINIANFEAFLSVFKLSKNPLFLKSGKPGVDRIFFGIPALFFNSVENSAGKLRTYQKICNYEFEINYF